MTTSRDSFDSNRPSLHSLGLAASFFFFFCLSRRLGTKFPSDGLSPAEAAFQQFSKRVGLRLLIEYQHLNKSNGGVALAGPALRPQSHFVSRRPCQT